MCVRLLNKLTLLALPFLVGCNIETTVPAAESSPSQAERAIFITDVQATGTGNLITCVLNDALVSPGSALEVFLEYKGTEIQRETLENVASVTFAEYNPPEDGEIVCVVEFADAEFESESMIIEVQ